MGYTIKVGNAGPHVPTEDYDNTPDWEVEGMSHPEAPTFPGDDLTSNTNARSPSYLVWANFLEEVGLLDLFFGADGRNMPGKKATREVCLMRDHPGVALLRPTDLLEIRQARERWEAKSWPTAERIAGWDPDERLHPWSKDFDSKREPDPRYDGNLARLRWLEWWAAYALANCKTPAVGNT
jgi:hypothetical protein